jgi:signal transduction histidine kinase
MKPSRRSSPLSNEHAQQPIHQDDDLEDLFENAPCGYLSADPSGRIFRANSTLAAWTGFPARSIVGRRFQELLNIAGRIYYETHFAPLLRMQGFFNEVALDLVCVDGSVLPTLVNAIEKRDEEGNAKSLRITVFNARDRRRYEQEILEERARAKAASQALQELNDTLERKIGEALQSQAQAESALRQAQKIEALGHLTGGIAHDFNNMLAVVIAGINLAQKQIARGETGSKPLQGALEGAQRAASLTSRLLAFSRQLPLTPEVVDINRLVSSVSEMLQRTLGEATRIETVLASGLWTTSVDVSQLENVLLNLAINARDAMPGGGKLTIETANAFLDEDYLTPARACRRTFSRRRPTRSSRPKRWARAPDLDSVKCTGSSSNRTAMSKSTLSLGGGLRSKFICHVSMERRH